MAACRSLFNHLLVRHRRIGACVNFLHMNRYVLSSRNFHQSIQRKFSNSSVIASKSYEPDGKTTVTILNDDAEAPLMVNSYSPRGFKLNNGITVVGPMVLFSKTVLGWDVGGVHNMTPEAFTLFTVLEPKIDILVIGVGDPGSQIPIETIKFLRKKKINLEILSTDHACTTFNFLSGERRCVAAVMLPPNSYTWTSTDLANTKLLHRELYADEKFSWDELVNPGADKKTDQIAPKNK